MKVSSTRSSSLIKNDDAVQNDEKSTHKEKKKNDVESTLMNVNETVGYLESAKDVISSFGGTLENDKNIGKDLFTTNKYFNYASKSFKMGLAFLQIIFIAYKNEKKIKNQEILINEELHHIDVKELKASICKYMKLDEFPINKKISIQDIERYLYERQSKFMSKNTFLIGMTATLVAAICVGAFIPVSYIFIIPAIVLTGGIATGIGIIGNQDRLNQAIKKAIENEVNHKLLHDIDLEILTSQVKELEKEKKNYTNKLMDIFNFSELTSKLAASFSILLSVILLPIATGLTLFAMVGSVIFSSVTHYIQRQKELKETEKFVYQRLYDNVYDKTGALGIFGKTHLEKYIDRYYDKVVDILSLDKNKSSKEIYRYLSSIHCDIKLKQKIFALVKYDRLEQEYKAYLSKKIGHDISVDSMEDIEYMIAGKKKRHFNEFIEQKLYDKVKKEVKYAGLINTFTLITTFFVVASLFSGPFLPLVILLSVGLTAIGVGVSYIASYFEGRKAVKKFVEQDGIHFSIFKEPYELYPYIKNNIDKQGIAYLKKEEVKVEVEKEVEEKAEKKVEEKVEKVEKEVEEKAEVEVEEKAEVEVEEKAEAEVEEKAEAEVNVEEKTEIKAKAEVESKDEKK